VREELRRIELLSENALNKDDLNVKYMVELYRRNILF